MSAPESPFIPLGPTLAQRYAPLFPVGEGGMGTVQAVLERQPGGYARVVALKRIAPRSPSDRRAREMFLREARLATLLSHPNVVQGYDFGEADGELFIAMEYVDGAPLGALLRRLWRSGVTLSPALTAHLIIEACEGLHAVHELCDPKSGQPLNVVHRDVSPHNLMVGFDGAIRLLDFGVAKADAYQGLTRTGEVKGKMAYMSPEQAMGDPVDRRSDLFAVGAVLFECVAAAPLWGAGSDMELMRKLAQETPPRLSDVVPGAPADLSAVQGRLVARRPAERYATATAVAEAVRCSPSAAGGAQRARSELAGLVGRHFAAERAARDAALTRALGLGPPHDAGGGRHGVGGP